MPWVLALLALGGLAAAAALSGRPAGAKTVAFLQNGPVLNVVWDGIRWRPMGSVDLAAVVAWNAAGNKQAEINGSELVWTGAGFS